MDALTELVTIKTTVLTKNDSAVVILARSKLCLR